MNLLFAHGFARARCDDCGHDYFVAFSCKGRGVCPSCNTRRMVETAAHLTDHVFPRLPVRQWVLSVPKRLRYFMQRDGAVLNMVLRVFLRVIEQSLSAHCPGSAQVDKAALHIGAVAFCAMRPRIMMRVKVALSRRMKRSFSSHSKVSARYRPIPQARRLEQDARNRAESNTCFGCS